LALGALLWITVALTSLGLRALTGTVDAVGSAIMSKNCWAVSGGAAGRCQTCPIVMLLLLAPIVPGVMAVPCSRARVKRW